MIFFKESNKDEINLSIAITSALNSQKRPKKIIFVIDFSSTRFNLGTLGTRFIEITGSDFGGNGFLDSMSYLKI